MKRIKLDHTRESMVFFTSDIHYSHKNICAGETNWVKFPIPFSEWEIQSKTDCHDFCRENGVRPFPSVEEMNEALITNINDLVLFQDHLFILGDIAFGKKEEASEFLKRIKCKNLYFVYGNHDRGIRENKFGEMERFKAHGNVMEVEVNGQQIFLSHYAHRVWDKSHRGVWHLYGHSHGSLEHTPWGKSMDVGVDTNEFCPYSLDEIRLIMDKRVPEIIDHHKTNR